jgi:hypothetical protein
MLMVVPDGVGVGVGAGVGAGVGVGAGAGFELLHAARLNPATRISAYRIDMRRGSAKRLPTAIARFHAYLESGFEKDLSRS